MARLRPRRWFLPETPDVLGLLREQAKLTIDGVALLSDWATGAEVSGSDFRAVQDRGDAARRELVIALREAFITPTEPEDLFAISRGLGWILDGAGDLIREADVLEADPDESVAEITKLLAACLMEIDSAISDLGSSGGRAMAAADRAIGLAREMQPHYYAGMRVTLRLKGRRNRIGRREIYRRCLAIGDITIDVSERIVYAVVKES
jgi:hypothetical protein